MGKIFFILILLFFRAAGATPENCVEHVKNTYFKRTQKLIADGTLKVDEFGNISSTFTEEKLYSDPRFRNFPAISLEQIRWCANREAVESSLDFLVQVGFRRSKMDTYFKRFLFLAKEDGLKVFKDQVGLTQDRVPFTEWADQDPQKKSMAAHYALALSRKATDSSKIESRAGSTFLGFFQNKAIFTLPYHALHLGESVKRCEDFEFYFPLAPQNPLKANSTVLTVPSLDLVFCSLQLTPEHHRLKPSPVDLKSLSRGQALLTLGVGQSSSQAKMQLTLDSSPDCQTLVEETDDTFDDSGVLDVKTRRWAMGCDVSAGNSGDGIFDRRTQAWVGIVTSRAPYVYQIYAHHFSLMDLPLQRLYLETSHYVPASQVAAHLKTLKNSDLNTLQKKWREWFLQLTF